MGNLNKVQIIGRICADIEKRVTPAGKSVVSISIATSEKYKDNSGVQQEKTEFHRTVFWGKLADLLGQFCKKGSQLYVEGSLQTNEWQDKDGNKRYTTEIVVRNMQFLDSKPQDQQGGYQQSQPAQSTQHQNQNYQTPPNQGPSNDFGDDDSIPY